METVQYRSKSVIGMGEKEQEHHQQQSTKTKITTTEIKKKSEGLLARCYDNTTWNEKLAIGQHIWGGGGGGKSANTGGAFLFKNEHIAPLIDRE